MTGASASAAERDTGTKTVRVFLVDDSPTARLGLRRMIESAEGLEVVGQASGGRAALRQIPAVDPSIVLMDVSMPDLDGLETTRRLMAEHPVPIVLISDLVGRRAELNFQAIGAGALDLLRKPRREELDDPSARAALARRLRVLAPVPLVTRRGNRRAAETAGSLPGPAPKSSARRSRATSSSADLSLAAPSIASAGPRAIDRMSVGASTGGPVALARLLSGFPRPPRWPIAVVQHMSPGFVHGLAKWLSGECGLPVEVVEERAETRPGHVYLSGDGEHMVWSGTSLEPRREPLGTLHRPSIDVLFGSAAATTRAVRHAGVLLTGMGTDGARGLLALRRAGALTVAQAEAGCVVFGMPRAAQELGAAVHMLAPEHIGPYFEQISKPTETSTPTSSTRPARAAF